MNIKEAMPAAATAAGKATKGAHAIGCRWWRADLARSAASRQLLHFQVTQ